eukprot:scaffold7215_cov366-Prasinococcus_capsulatus_cf.AAC.30
MVVIQRRLEQLGVACEAAGAQYRRGDGPRGGSARARGRDAAAQRLRCLTQSHLGGERHGAGEHAEAGGTLTGECGCRLEFGRAFATDRSPRSRVRIGGLSCSCSCTSGAAMAAVAHAAATRSDDVDGGRTPKQRLERTARGVERAARASAGGGGDKPSDQIAI